MSGMRSGALPKSTMRIFPLLNPWKLLSPSEPAEFTVALPKEIIMALSNTLKLYQSAASPNSRRVRIFLAEKGLELTLVPVDLGKGEQRSDKYRLINPREMAPTLARDE